MHSINCCIRLQRNKPNICCGPCNPWICWKFGSNNYSSSLLSFCDYQPEQNCYRSGSYSCCLSCYLFIQVFKTPFRAAAIFNLRAAMLHCSKKWSYIHSASRFAWMWKSLSLILAFMRFLVWWCVIKEFSCHRGLF